MTSVDPTVEPAALPTVKEEVKTYFRLLAITLVASALLALTTAAAHAAPLPPRSIKAVYAGTMNGMNIGVITEHFEYDKGRYRIVSETRPQGLAVLLQRQPLRFNSSGTIDVEGLRPLVFEGRRAIGDAPQVTAEFDWKDGRLVLKHGGKSESMALPAGTQDRLSIMYHFMFLPLTRTGSVVFPMTNGRKLDTYRYRASGETEIDTGLGRLKTLHLVKQRDPGDTVTEVWLSTTHHFLPARLLIVEKDGLRFEQVLQSLDVHD